MEDVYDCFDFFVIDDEWWFQIDDVVCGVVVVGVEEDVVMEFFGDEVVDQLIFFWEWFYCFLVLYQFEVLQQILVVNVVDVWMFVEFFVQLCFQMFFLWYDLFEQFFVFEYFECVIGYGVVV